MLLFTLIPQTSGKSIAQKDLSSAPGIVVILLVTNSTCGFEWQGLSTGLINNSEFKKTITWQAALEYNRPVLQD